MCELNEMDYYIRADENKKNIELKRDNLVLLKFPICENETDGFTLESGAKYLRHVLSEALLK